MTDSTLTPMLRQYHELKRQHPGTLLFFRLGDFYELFFDDAVTGARELEITLTARHKERGSAIPMCGVPHHAAAGHIARLVRKGYRVAVCEQTEDPSKAKKLVRREVVRVITPGTAIDPQLLDSRETVFLAAVCAAGDSYGAAFLDLSTGEFRATQAAGGDAWQRVRADIESYGPRELLFPASLAPLVRETFGARDQAPPLAAAANSAATNGAAQSNDPAARPAGANTQPASPTAQPAASNVVPFPRAASNGAGNFALALTPLDDWLWEPVSCESVLLGQFGARTLEGYGLADKPEAISAAGACLRYARETQREAAAHVNDITYFEPQDALVLDAVTVRNLELFESQSGAHRSNTLFGVLDETVTGMGARLLRSWLLRPSVKRGEIEARLGAVEEFHSSQVTRDRVRALLKEVADLERLTARVNMNTATPRDLSALCRSLGQVPPIRKALSDAKASLLEILREGADELPDVCKLLSDAISDEPPPALSEPGTIREGYSAELDGLRAASRDAKQTIAALEARERQRSGIASLRVRFNNVFGYFIEVSKGASSRVPADYERRQTLANAERFATPELKEWERKVLGAEDRIRELETTLFAEVRARVAAETRRLQATARSLAMLDALSALAETAARRRYRKPQLHDTDEIEIVAGRHPVIEALSDAPFVPNDLYMNNSTDRLLIITGPNMGGKCLRGDAIIPTGAGLVPLESLRPEGARPGGFTPLTAEVLSRAGRDTATHFYTGGRQPTVRLTTRFGYQLEGTREHRVWARLPDGTEGWKRLDELAAGDVLAIDRRGGMWGRTTAIDLRGGLQLDPRAKRYPLPAALNEDLAYLMGLLVGDGTLTGGDYFGLTTADEFIARSFVRIVAELFGYTVRTEISGITYRVSSKQLRAFLAALDLGRLRSHEKHVPASIMRAPRRVVTAFLQGLFDADGWAANKQVKVHLATGSPRLAREVQLLLLNYGIVASLRAKRTAHRPSYQIGIYGTDAISFHRQIGFRLPRKRERRNLASAIRMPNIGIPYLATTLKDVQRRIVTTAGKPVALKRNQNINSIFYTYLPSQRNISYRKLGELIEYCRQNGVICSELERLQRQNYFYDTVTGVEAGEADVFDLNVAGAHSYTANGFVSHNSTVLRQAALVCLLAQAGSFVPAERARLPVLDRIWTRVGASDDLARGRSTFMVEMTETAAILHSATPRSLVLLDEIGRGTATFDGLSIAWAVAEHLHDSPDHAAKTLFATHYHELTELAERLPGAQNYQIRVAERDGSLVFLYRLERGRASKSYGIEVARLAGLPPAVVERAREVLERLERYELEVFSEEIGEASAIGEASSASSSASAVPSSPPPAAPSQNAQASLAADVRGAEPDGLGRAARRARRRAIAAQATLFDAANRGVLDDLRAAELEKLSHEELRSLLSDIRKRIV